MDFALDPDSGTPLYLQLKDQIRYAVAVGELRPGDTLPSIRVLEATLGVNRNTALRAYRELDREGLLRIRQGAEAAVAPRPGTPPQPARDAEIRELAATVVRDVEVRGLDSLSFAAALRAAAIEHDRSYPKCAFVECSRTQAEDFARAAAEALDGRRVLAIDLDELRKDSRSLPSSARFLMTTSWHAAELAELVREREIVIRVVGVRPASRFLTAVRRLEDRTTGLLVRDPESVAGYRNLIRKHARVKGRIQTALLGDRAKAERLFHSVEGLVFTAPSRDFVEGNAPRNLLTVELLCEPVPEDLDRIREEYFHPGNEHWLV